MVSESKSANEKALSALQQRISVLEAGSLGKSGDNSVKVGAKKSRQTPTSRADRDYSGLNRGDTSANELDDGDVSFKGAGAYAPCLAVDSLNAGGTSGFSTMSSIRFICSLIELSSTRYCRDA